MKIKIEPYNPAWKVDFEQHKMRILEAMPQLVPSIDHIGSTSLGDIGAKLIIDIIVGL